MCRYHTILFDADNTLLDFSRSERAAVRLALADFGVMAKEDLIATYSAINDRYWKMLERGEISKAALRTARFAELCRTYDLNLDAAALADRYVDVLCTQSFLVEGALEVCRALAAHCRLYVITNGMARVQHGRFDSSALYPFFSGAFISDEIGFEKPSMAYFDAVRRAIPDFDPETTLVVGDSLSSDIAGGIAAGLPTCWYNPCGKVIPEGLAVTHTVRRLEEIIPLVLA